MPSPHTVLAPTASSSALPGPPAVPSSVNPSPIAIPRSSLNNISSQQKALSFSNQSSSSAGGGQSHIASALVNPSQSFSAASLPRTSSLLPPPHLARQPASTPAAANAHLPPLFRNPFLDHPPAPAAAELVATNPEPAASRRRPSRSSSAGGGLNDGFRNLNRWSASTTSSLASNQARPSHSRTPSLGRRMSVDTVALQAQTNAPASVYQSPRKLQKSRPSTSSGGSPRPATATTRVRQQSPAPVPPLTSLPPIVSLPSLEQEVRGGSPSLAGNAATQRPQYRRQASTDDAAYLWDDTELGPGDSAQADRAGSISGKPDTAEASSTMPTDRSNGDGVHAKGHSRNRSQNAKGSADSSKSRDRSSKQPSQKAMLSKALQKANAAVQLDNAGNIEGARQAYAEACDLLQQVLLRTTGEEDRRKLEAIRGTYTTRIDELDQLEPTPQEKDVRPLPRRPESNHRRDTSSPRAGEERDEDLAAGMKTTGRLGSRDGPETRRVPSYSVPIPVPRPQPTFTPGPPDIPRYAPSSLLSEQYTLQSSFSRSPRKDSATALTIQRPADNLYIPPPLSPRKPPSPTLPSDKGSPPDAPLRADFSMSGARLSSENNAARGHVRGNSHESVSWLDPIDESGGSRGSSVHSRSSSMGVRRKHIRAASGDTEAEFDAALDDAIEAAYDEGYEPMDPVEANGFEEDGEAVVAKALLKVELAKERVRESEREALALANERERRLREQLEQQEREEQEEFGETVDFYDGNDSDEEERLLEEMTQGYVIEDFSFGPLPPKPSIPRASDSSEMTSRTWHSSMASNPPTATTVMSNLSTVSENTVIPTLSKGATSTMPPPPLQSLPQLPAQPLITVDQSPTKESVRSRRLSGQNPKELKIETSKLGPSATSPATAGAAAAGARPGFAGPPAVPTQPKTAGFIVQQRQALSAGPNRQLPSRQIPSPAPVPSPGGDGPLPTPPPPPPLPPAELDARSGSPSVSRPGLRKNFSSSSLRSMKSRNLSVSALDDGSDLSPGTPSSNHFGANARLPAMPSLPTPVATAFKERMTAGGGTGGLYLFDTDLHSPNSPGSPNPLALDGPAPLEPCPNDCMLRPFWLMRCLYQTLAHPRGGYISNKLFVPRDVWKVKGVKLKNVDEKIANCDFLTAALMKLAKVDNCDADALLEEMQSLEGVLEQVQSALSRRLGSEVGVQAASTLFKDASSSFDADSTGNVPRSTSVSGKPSSFSWRRLRSKNSSAGLGSAYSDRGRKESIADGGVTKETASLASLPMTSHPTSRPTKRDLVSVQFSGPYANYMGALAKLFDAAQTIDQIARQVEDPGLRHADKTQVGLELCTRHAAEFFAFYICRFVLSDLTLLLDKFVKRGSEYVLV